MGCAEPGRKTCASASAERGADVFIGRCKQAACPDLDRDFNGRKALFTRGARLQKAIESVRHYQHNPKDEASQFGYTLNQKAKTTSQFRTTTPIRMARFFSILGLLINIASP